MSLLRPLRPRLARFVGVDIHAPAKPLGWLDEFAVADLCTDTDAFPPGTFDVALSNFTVEHFADPAWRRSGPSAAGSSRVAGWSSPRSIGATRSWTCTSALPGGLRSRLQPVVKESEADAHPLVGACNTPRQIREGLAAAGYTDIELRTTEPPGPGLGTDPAHVGAWGCWATWRRTPCPPGAPPSSRVRGARAPDGAAPADPR